MRTFTYYDPNNRGAHSFTLFGDRVYIWTVYHRGGFASQHRQFRSMLEAGQYWLRQRAYFANWLIEPAA